MYLHAEWKTVKILKPAYLDLQCFQNKIFPGSTVLVSNIYLALLHMPYKLVLIRYTNFTFPNIIKSIGFRMRYFLILCQSLS